MNKERSLSEEDRIRWGTLVLVARLAGWRAGTHVVGRPHLEQPARCSWRKVAMYMNNRYGVHRSEQGLWHVDYWRRVAEQRGSGRVV